MAHDHASGGLDEESWFEASQRSDSSFCNSPPQLRDAVLGLFTLDCKHTVSSAIFVFTCV